jgi:hypothetical protein
VHKALHHLHATQPWLATLHSAKFTEDVRVAEIPNEKILAAMKSVQ